MVQIVPVRNKRQLDTFITFPFKLYKNNPYWVPPSYRMKNLPLIKRKPGI